LSIPAPRPPPKYFKLNTILTIVLSALAIPIHIGKIDFPLAPFLKFDFCGIPLAVAGFINLSLSISLGLPIFYLGILVIGATNPLSPLMKVLAEASTYIPMVYLYRRLHSRKISYKTLLLILTAVAMVSRCVIMTILNIIITPLIATLFWGAPSYEVALTKIIIPTLHLINIFNAITALYVAILSMPIIRIISKEGLID